jgi:DNA repair exonuclease SbcCD ATPase subunit
MNTLLKIALINSAKFDFSEVNVEANTLLIGANGSGKTTMLRALLYFYTANSKALGISPSKKTTFSEYYFEYDNSYIAYIYKKNNRYVLVIVYKSTSIYIKMCLLNSMPNIKEIFIKEQNILLNPQDIWLKLKDIGTLSNRLTPKEYIQTLYGKTSKQKEYSLFFAKDYDGFIKTLSNIFINSKVDSNTIKKVLVSSLEVNQEIDLKRIKRHLEVFNTTYEDILSYENHIKIVQKIDKELNNLQKIKDDLKLTLSVIDYSKTAHLKNIQEYEIEQNSIKGEIDALKNNLDYEHNLFEKRTTTTKEKIGIFKNSIKEIKELNIKYDRLNIDEKIAKYNSLDMQKAKLKNLISQKDFLINKQKDLETSHQNRLDEIENDFNTNKNSQISIKMQTIEKLQNQINEIKDNQNQEIISTEEEFNRQILELNHIKNTIKLDINSLENEQKNTKNTKFNFEEDEFIAKLKDENKSIEYKVLAHKESINHLSNQLKQKEQNIYDQIKSLEAKQIQEIKLKDDRLAQIKLLINPVQDSLLDTIYSTNKECDKYLYFIKDEILSKSFDIDFDFNSSSNSIFEVDFKDFDAPKNDLSQQINQINHLKKEILEEYQTNYSNIQRELKKFENSIIRKKKELNEELKEYDKTLMINRTKLNKIVETKEKNQKIFAQNRDAKISELQDLLNENSDKLNSIDTQIKEETDNKSTKLNSIKIYYSKKLKTIQNEIVSINKEYDELIRNLQNQKQNQKKQQIDIYHKLLTKENIDTNQLKEYDKNIDNLKNSIKSIEALQEIIFEYKNDKKKIQMLKQHQKELKEHKDKLSKLTVDFNDIQSNLTTQIEALTKNFYEKKNKIKTLNEQFSEFEDFEHSSLYIQAKQIIISPQIDEFLPLKELSMSITRLHTLYHTSQDSIQKLINRVGDIFDNTLEIRRDANILKSAKRVQEFYQLDKIKLFKEMQIKSLNQNIAVLIQEYDKLMLQSSKIQRLVKSITKLFLEIKIGVIDELNLRYQKTDNKTIEILEQIKNFTQDSIGGFGVSLFDDGSSSKNMIKLFRDLILTIEDLGYESISLEDSFVLDFRVVENGNDSKYQASLDNIGSNGTDVLVKSMIYIAIVHIFKKKITKEELQIHTILDEIGILSQRYLKALIEFANRYGISFINGAPDEKLIGTYKRVYLVQRDGQKSNALEIISQ